MSMHYARAIVGCTAGWLLMAGLVCSAAAQTADLPKAPDFPADPRAWLNSPPLSLEMLRGKGAVLWYYEEGCPRCRERWPEMLSEARKFQGKPVVFIAVNSGSSPAEVLRYVRENRIDWPVIIDTSRQFEQQSGVPEVSLQNIYQMRVLAPDGTLRRSGGFDVADAANELLKEAKWKVDPADVPEGLRTAWQAVEFGDYTKGAPLIKRSINARDEATKNAAAKLQAAVEAEWTRMAEAAHQATAAGRQWEAFKTYSQIAAQFKGYELPPEIEATRRELEQSSEIKREFEANKRYEAATKIAPTNAASRNRLIATLKLLTTDFAGTEAAQKAESLLGQLNAGN